MADRNDASLPYPLAGGRSTDHDPFDCECHESCSWCTQAEVESQLYEVPDEGARICRDCRRDLRAGVFVR